MPSGKSLSERRSFVYCERLAARTGRNFYPTFRILPPSQRQAMCALYAFLRIADDIADEPGDAAAKVMALADWRRRTQLALAGTDSHPLHPALRRTVEQYEIPQRYLFDVFDGCEMDLAAVQFQNFEQLYQYCYLVASAVGLACVHIWGFRGREALRWAESAGIAFQLTNILRDLDEDFQRGRVYLPADELTRFDCPPERWLEQGSSFQELMDFQVSRAKWYFSEGEQLLPYLPNAGRAVFSAMSWTYRGLLNEIERRRFDVFRERVTLPAWRKLGYLLAALPIRWGWG